MRNSTNPDFVEAIARGVDVIKAFGEVHGTLSLSEVAERAELARPTARRILITLVELGLVRSSDSRFQLTARVLDLGMAYVSSGNIWDIVRPHLEDLSRATNESCSVAQLDGSDIVYVARVAVPKLVALSVNVGTRFPAMQTSLGKVLLAALPPAELDLALSSHSLSRVEPTWHPGRAEIDDELSLVRRQGWALTDQQLAPAIRSVAAPITDGTAVVGAVNVNTHAMETSLEKLVDVHLPLLLGAAGRISLDWAAWDSRPERTLGAGAARI